MIKYYGMCCLYESVGGYCKLKEKTGYNKFKIGFDFKKDGESLPN